MSSSKTNRSTLGRRSWFHTNLWAFIAINLTSSWSRLALLIFLFLLSAMSMAEFWNKTEVSVSMVITAFLPVIALLLTLWLSYTSLRKAFIWPHLQDAIELAKWEPTHKSRLRFFADPKTEFGKPDGIGRVPAYPLQRLLDEDPMRYGNIEICHERDIKY